MSVYKGQQLVAGTPNMSGKANIDLNNLSETGKNVIDGQWVISSLQLLSGGSLTTTLVNYDISSYLPNDSYIYEVIVKVGNANSYAVNVYSDLLQSNSPVVARGASSGTAQLYNCGIVLVGQSRTISANTYSGTSSNTLIDLLAYRRIGTNN